MPMNRKRDVEFHLNDQKMEVVDDHVYLGTIVSRNGQRIKDMQDRIKKTKSVANEIVQICKETELSKIRLRYVKLLTSSCLDSKVKYGSDIFTFHLNNTWKDSSYLFLVIQSVYMCELRNMNCDC